MLGHSRDPTRWNSYNIQLTFSFDGIIFIKLSTVKFHYSLIYICVYKTHTQPDLPRKSRWGPFDQILSLRMVVWSDAVLCEIMTKACHYMNQLLSTKCSEFLILICFPEFCLDLGIHNLHEKYKLITDCPWAMDKNKSLSNHRCPFKNTKL